MRIEADAYCHSCDLCIDARRRARARQFACRAGATRGDRQVAALGQPGRSRSEGKYVETWTLDGDALNKVNFFGGVATGQPLLRQANKNRPLPKVAGNMLITDIPVLLETTYRSQFAVNQMQIDSQEPALLGGRKGIRFTYRFTRADDEVQRKGEAIGAMVDGKLYLVTYEAPALYFFAKDIEKFRTLAASLKF